jgi:hypothetical protein
MHLGRFHGGPMVGGCVGGGDSAGAGSEVTREMASVTQDAGTRTCQPD